jgi:hypothetical protein
MRCSECGRGFHAGPDEFGDVPDVCPRCQEEDVREHAPELLGDGPDQPDPGQELGGEAGGA